LSCCKRKAKAALARRQRLENIGAAYTIENLPVDLSKPTGKFAKIDPLADLVSIRIGYEDSN